MAKRLSEQLADLSVHAKSAEDAADAARKEARGKITARRQQARDAATAATEKVSAQIKSVGDTAAKTWSAVRAKVAVDMTTLKADVAQKQHDRDAHRAEKRANDLEWEAGFAIDYAIASIEQAKVAVLDAIDARIDAEEAKQIPA